jgi:hypothetical protein
MSRIKSLSAVLLITLALSIVPSAYAATSIEVTIGGSSSVWQTLALAAYKEAGSGAGHWTSASNVIDLTDSRVTPVNVDPGTIWIIWNSGATKVWSYTKVDSVVGDRCYFAQPQCTVSGTLSVLSGSGSNQISSALWGDGSSDQALPSNVQSIFTTGTSVNVAASVVRPEDAAFAMCRANSLLGAGSYGGGASDGLDGLGYNSNWAAGICPASGSASSEYVGTPVKSGYPGSTGQANVVSFNIKGKDPITNTTIPAFTVVNLGASPLIFIFERSEGQLANLANATPAQLQQAFSGANCDASAFGLPAGGLNLFSNEPIAGTSILAESTIFRRPTVYTGTGTGTVLGLSLEANVGSNDPLAGQSGTCLNGAGARYRAIGASEEVKSVLNSGSKFGGLDGIGYAVFSYGNISTIANNSEYGYITVNNVDPLFASYGPQNSTGTGYDPGQPPNATNPSAPAGTLPGAANLPSSCSNAFPCPENDIWAGGLSFPNLRNGTYPVWAVLNLVSNGTPLKNAEALAKVAQQFVVGSVPDFVPFVKTTVGSVSDPGLLLVDSHYQQYDGAGNLIGAAPVNSGTDEAGGDVGGEVLSSTAKTTQQVQGVQGLQVRP